MEVNGQFHALFAWPPRKDPPVVSIVKEEAGWSSWSRRSEEGVVFPPYRESNSPVQHKSHHYTEWVILDPTKQVSLMLLYFSILLHCIVQ
jgi:hypothetical protein